MKFGFLSTLDNRLLPYFIKYAALEGIEDVVIFLDSKKISQKNNEIFDMRTNGFFGSYESVNSLLFTESKSFPYFFVNSQLHFY